MIGLRRNKRGDYYTQITRNKLCWSRNFKYFWNFLNSNFNFYNFFRKIPTKSKEKIV